MTGATVMRSGRRTSPTAQQIVAVTAQLLGTRGIEHVSLDEIAVAAGVRKQTVLYWFGSRAALVDTVIDVTVDELVTEVIAALAGGPSDALAQVDTIVVTVFDAAVRRPHLLGVLRDLRHLPSDRSDAVTSRLRPLVDAAVDVLEREMGQGRIRRGDPAVMVGLLYACIGGIAADPVARGVMTPGGGIAGLRRLRREVRAFVRAAVMNSAVSS